MNYEPVYNKSKVHPPKEENLRKLEKSKYETEDLTERIIKCPVCGFGIETVYSDAIGHIKVKCQKCKFIGAINLSYFRTQKTYSHHHYYWNVDTIIR